MRIAIVGAGPTGFFLAGALLKSGAENLTIDMFEKTPFPFGLVRFGVAPDHPKIKSVTKGFQKTMAHPNFSFWGNVILAESEKPGDINTEELLNHYDRVILTVGCQDDRKLEIPNEEAPNSFSATRFVGWYNGHPDDVDLSPDLKIKHVTIVGAGNVAIDVVRFVAAPYERMSLTDASGHSLQALRESTISQIDVLVRRGPWDVAFTNPEVKELLDFTDIQYTFYPELPSLEQQPPYADRRSIRNLEVFHELALRQVPAPRTAVNFRFQVSPTALKTDAQGRLKSVVLQHNDLEFEKTGSKITATDRTSSIPTDLFIRSVGYRGRPLQGVPFDERSATIPCDPTGRVLQADGSAIPGLYVSGWIRRGPSGVIGTNKKDAQEVATAVLEDERPTGTSSESSFLAWRDRLINKPAISKDDWSLIDQWESARGKNQGKPREKLITHDDVRAALRELKAMR